MKNKKSSKREIKAKKSTPRIYLNIHNNLVFLSFKAHSKILEDKEFQKVKNTMPRPNKICICISFTDVKTLLFSVETDLTIHEDVAKYLMARKKFRDELNALINSLGQTIIRYSKKAKSSSDRDTKVAWYTLIREEQVKLNSLLEIKSTLMDLIT